MGHCLSSIYLHSALTPPLSQTPSKPHPLSVPPSIESIQWPFPFSLICWL